MCPFQPTQLITAKIIFGFRYAFSIDCKTVLTKHNDFVYWHKETYRWVIFVDISNISSHLLCNQLMSKIIEIDDKKFLKVTSCQVSENLSRYDFNKSDYPKWQPIMRRIKSDWYISLRWRWENQATRRCFFGVFSTSTSSLTYNTQTYR